MRKNVVSLSFSRFLSAHMIGYYGENGAVFFETSVNNRDFEYSDREVKFFAFGRDSADRFAPISSFTISPCLMITVDDQAYLGVLKNLDTETHGSESPFTLLKADHITAPLYEEMPVVFECRKTRIEKMNILGAYVYADIENISVSPTIMDDDGTVNLHKMLSQIHFVKVKN